MFDRSVLVPSLFACALVIAAGCAQPPVRKEAAKPEKVKLERLLRFDNPEIRETAPNGWKNYRFSALGVDIFSPAEFTFSGPSPKPGTWGKYEMESDLQHLSLEGGRYPRDMKRTFEQEVEDWLGSTEGHPGVKTEGRERRSVTIGGREAVLIRWQYKDDGASSMMDIYCIKDPDLMFALVSVYPVENAVNAQAETAGMLQTLRFYTP